MVLSHNLATTLAKTVEKLSRWCSLDKKISIKTWLKVVKEVCCQGHVDICEMKISHLLRLPGDGDTFVLPTYHE